MYFAKVYGLDGGGLMAAIADEEVLGKVAIDRSRNIVIMVSESFYKGRLVQEDEAVDLMARADVLVLAGDRIIGKAIEMGLVNPDSVLRIGGLSHVQVYKFPL